MKTSEQYAESADTQLTTIATQTLVNAILSVAAAIREQTERFSTNGVRAHQDRHD